MKIAQIKDKAPLLFAAQSFNRFQGQIPEKVRKFEKVLDILKGHILPVGKEYDKVVHLRYPPNMIRKKMVITPEGGWKEVEIKGIDLDKNLVRLFDAENIDGGSK